MRSDPLIATLPQPRLAVLLLAGGEGSRLGSHPKALLRRDGQTLIERFSRVVNAFSPVQYVVVTGFHADAIEAELARLSGVSGMRIETRRNLASERGQASSVRLGLESLNPEFDVLLVALSDQPDVGAQEIDELLTAFSLRQHGQEMVLPMVGECRGNPALFSKKAVEEMLSQPGVVCRKYMDEHPEHVRKMQTQNNAFILDVDTLDDVQTHRLTLT